MADRNLNGYKPASAVAGNGGNKPDLKGTIDVAAWWNTDTEGNTYLAVQIGNRAKLVKNEQKNEDQ
jgi:hypothetical protein